jgi:hypothetical protein
MATDRARMSFCTGMKAYLAGTNRLYFLFENDASALFKARVGYLPHRIQTSWHENSSSRAGRITIRLEGKEVCVAIFFSSNRICEYMNGC